MKRRILSALGVAGTAAMLFGGLFSRPISLVAQAVKSTLVRDADEPGRAPYTEMIPWNYKLNGCGQDLCVLHFSPVPAGKRLVITGVSFYYEPTPDYFAYPYATLIINQARGNPSGTVTSYPLSAVRDVGWMNGNSRRNTGNHQILAFAEGGTGAAGAPQVEFRTGNDLDAGQLQQYVTLSGYYISIP